MTRNHALRSNKQAGWTRRGQQRKKNATAQGEPLGAAGPTDKLCLTPPPAAHETFDIQVGAPFSLIPASDIYPYQRCTFVHLHIYTCVSICMCIHIHYHFFVHVHFHFCCFLLLLLFSLCYFISTNHIHIFICVKICFSVQLYPLVGTAQEDTLAPQAPAATSISAHASSCGTKHFDVSIGPTAPTSFQPKIRLHA